MSEKNLDTLFELLEEYKIEVPIVQRDYAQGRQDEDAKRVRGTLLEDIRKAILRETPSLDLNFVYGKAENGKFIPIDGQQRLTTLFLLHLYAFAEDDSKTSLLKKFTYATRTSSRDFFKELIEKRAVVFRAELKPSEEIKDSEWFISTWNYDPTIQSSLVMLDDIKTAFGDVENLALSLVDGEFKPIVFNFLEMNDLGMEDSLYIKMNARGRALTPFENLKARLIGRLKEILPDRTQKFEEYFDTKWANVFWVEHKEKFDQGYLAFLGVLLMNARSIETDSNTDSNWPNLLDFSGITAEIFNTAFYTLNFISDDLSDAEAKRLVLMEQKEVYTYPDRVLFHAVTTYLYQSKGRDSGSLGPWLRIIKNLTLNSRIDTFDSSRRAIDGINKLADNWEDLLLYFAQNGEVTGFSLEQIKEEKSKARLMLENADFAEKIYDAEQHPYFSGQIGSALNCATGDNGKPDIDLFERYWSKIALLFSDSKPKHGHLLRRALLTFGDYTLEVGSYKTLCVDDPDEGSSTPSLKRLFSKNIEFVKQFLDVLDARGDIKVQLENIVQKSTVSKNDWRYCFIHFPTLFEMMSPSHLRLRFVENVPLIIRNKSSMSYNDEVFLAALKIALSEKGIESASEGEKGAVAERFLCVNGLNVIFENGCFVIKDKQKNVVYRTKTEDPINEVLEYSRQR